MCVCVVGGKGGSGIQAMVTATSPSSFHQWPQRSHTCQQVTMQHRAWHAALCGVLATLRYTPDLCTQIAHCHATSNNNSLVVLYRTFKHKLDHLLAHSMASPSCTIHKTLTLISLQISAERRPATLFSLT